MTHSERKVFVPPPRKAGSVKDMAKMLPNVGLENNPTDLVMVPTMAFQTRKYVLHG